MGYIENPKTEGSSIICCIPQVGICPNKCADCFFQSGRSYLEPLDENLPNMPELKQTENRIVRVNDGNDSNFNRDLVLKMVKGYGYEEVFFNTAIPMDLEGFKIDGKIKPVVLTLNPAGMTDKVFYKLNPIPRNLMFVRFRINTWNLKVADQAIRYYAANKIPVVLTFMAYYGETIPEGHKFNYIFRKRVLNSYWVIKAEAWDMIVERYKGINYVFTCGKDVYTFPCMHCGNCEQEYWNTMKRLKKFE